MYVSHSISSCDNAAATFAVKGTTNKKVADSRRCPQTKATVERVRNLNTVCDSRSLSCFVPLDVLQATEAGDALVAKERR